MTHSCIYNKLFQTESILFSLFFFTAWPDIFPLLPLCKAGKNLWKEVKVAWLDIFGCFSWEHNTNIWSHNKAAAECVYIQKTLSNISIHLGGIVHERAKDHWRRSTVCD